MTPAAICRAVYDAGMTVRARGENLVVTPADKLTPDLRALLLEHKFTVLRFLAHAHITAEAVATLAMKVCDEYGDSPQAREQMVQDVMQTPAHLVTDLLQHFQSRTGAKPC